MSFARARQGGLVSGDLEGQKRRGGWSDESTVDELEWRDR